MFFIRLAVLYFFVNECSTQFFECTTNQDCIADQATCINNLCTCPIGFVFSADRSRCLSVSLGLNAACEDSHQCGWLSGDYECVKNKCACAPGWTYMMGQCLQFGVLNQDCNGNHQCFNGYDVLAMVCRNNKCVCNDGYYNRGNFDCRPAITTPGEFCSLDSDCKFQNGKCQNSYCINQSTPVKRINVTVQNLLDTRASIKVSDKEIDPSCATCSSIPNAMCYLGFQKCYCKRGFYYDSESNSCVGELGADIGCTNDTECLIPYSRCFKGHCYCRQSYFTITATSCQKPMTHDNLFCNNNERCYTLGPHSKCENNQCKCTLPVEPDENFVCEAPSTCADDMGCTEIKNSICVDNTCQCPENCRIEDNTCFPNLGGECIDRCTIDHASCNSENVCSCDEKFIQSGDTTCLPVAILGSECVINEQCLAVTTNAACVGSKCTCIEKYTNVSGECLDKLEMGDMCKNGNHCRATLGSDVVCRKGYCSCPANMRVNEARINCESSANTFTLAYSLIILMISLNLLQINLL